MKKLYSLAILAAGIMAFGQPATAMADDTVVFYESFNGLNGQGGNDGYFDNDDVAGVEVGAEDLLDATQLDNTSGWGDFVKVAICNKCVRLATKKNPGELTTPAFNLSGDKATLTFNAAAQLGDNSTLYVEIVGDGTLTYNGTTATQFALTMPTTEAGVTNLAAQTYTMEISGAQECQLKFSAVSSKSDKQRVFLDEIRVVKATTSGITSLEPVVQDASAAIYTLSGQRLAATSLHSLPAGLYIQNGKKVLVK